MSTMETELFDRDVTVFYVTANSFPDGILAAHQQLHSLVPFSTERRYFGISRPENGPIIYRAATEELEPGEAVSYGCETLVLRKGNYACIVVEDFMSGPNRIGTAFEQLLAQPGLDPEGYCVEWYLNDEKTAKCMVRLAD